MEYSLVICSHNRSEQLRSTLAKLDQPGLKRFGFQVVLVDSGSTDDTLRVMKEFATAALPLASVLSVPRKGLGLARNVGIEAARGDVILFTDDDCYLHDQYLPTLVAQFDPIEFQYGGGDVYLFDWSDDPTGTFQRSGKVVLPPKTILKTGVVQGANMFFARRALVKLGGFAEDLGAGTTFPCEDIEMCTRASLAGYAGVILPELIVYHHHRRQRGSARLKETLDGYDRGRGAYYSLLMTRGVHDAWKEWADSIKSREAGPPTLKHLCRMEREFRGAADLLAQEIAKRPQSEDG